MSTPSRWAFPALLTGETISAIGSGLSAFAVAVYVFRQTGSVTAYSLISLAAVVPALLAAPLAGHLVDRWPRKTVMICSNLSCSTLTALVSLIAFAGKLQLWEVGALAALNATAATFYFLAFTSATTLLVPADKLGSASGMAQASVAVAQLVAPALAGGLYGVLDLQGILTLDAAGFLIALIIALATPIAEPARSTDPRVPGAEEKLSFGFRYLFARPGLLGTLFLQASISFGLGMATVLLLPLVLSFGTAASYGAVLSSAGVGMLAGALLIGVSGGSRKRVRMLWAGGALSGLGLIGGGLLHSVPGVAGCAFAVGLAVPIVNASGQVIFQLRVSPELQGRVFAARQAVIGGMVPLAYVVAGPLADHLLSPALLLAATGILSLAVTAWTLLDPRVRSVEDDQPVTVAA